MSQPFEPPAAEPGGDADLDPRAAVPGILVRLGALALAMAGCFVAGSGVQLFAFFLLSTWIKLVAAAMIGFGGIALLDAGFLFQGRAWAAWIGVALGTFLALFSGVWLLYALSSGLFSLMMLVAALLSANAAMFTVLALPGALRATAARNALYR